MKMTKPQRIEFEAWLNRINPCVSVPKRKRFFEQAYVRLSHLPPQLLHSLMSPWSPPKSNMPDSDDEERRVWETSEYSKEPHKWISSELFIAGFRTARKVAPQQKKGKGARLNGRAETFKDYCKREGLEPELCPHIRAHFIAGFNAGRKET